MISKILFAKFDFPKFDFPKFDFFRFNGLTKGPGGLIFYNPIPIGPSFFGGGDRVAGDKWGVVCGGG